MTTSADPISAGRARPAFPSRDALELGLFAGLLLGLNGMTAFVAPEAVNGNAVGLVELGLSVALVLLFRFLRREPWSVLGLGRPKSIPRTIGFALLATPVVKGVTWLAGYVVLQVMADGAEPDLSRFNALEGNLPLLLMGVATIWVTAAFAEELIYRGFFLGRLSRVLGGTRGAWWCALAVTSVIFGLLHLYQGWAGVFLTGFAGFLLGVVYLFSGRNLWVAILVHGLMNTVSLSLLYAGYAG
jgi:membrane protease YdiL (CAAX protease family)